jgi:hypothetical protein
MVLGLGIVLVLVTATALAATSSGSVKSDNEADWNAALAAAYAGIEDYSSRVENDTSYVRFGNPASEFSSASTGLSLPTGANANPAFEVSAGGAWATVPGSDGKARFRYEIDTSRYAATGVIRIRSTGLVGDQTRSVIADLRQDGFSDFVYFTDFETQDPLITSGSDDYCENYWWNRPPQKTSGFPWGANCTDIQFASYDTIDGKVHSNDRILICGATFTGAVTTASATNPLYGINGGCSDGNFELAPRRVAPITMPDTNSEMKKETRSDLPGEVPDPGCLYTGPTVIKLNGDGTMTVWSPYTKKTQTTGVGTGSTPSKCGAIGTSGNALGSTTGATVAVLDLNLLYVQNVPNVSTDPNYTSTSTSPARFFCSGSGSSQGWSIATSSGSSSPAQKFPATRTISGVSRTEATPNSSTSTNPAYGCRNGDLFISGSISGRMTAAAENYVYITGDLTYANQQEDMLGIVGQNAVWVWNPMYLSGGWSSTYVAMLPDDRNIYASLLSVAHTIQVQNYQLGGERGTLYIKGSMAQKFRGPVGQGSNGYAKSYHYDARLTYSAPPKYLTPTSTTYGTTQIAGVPSAFSADGSPR